MDWHISFAPFFSPILILMLGFLALSLIGLMAYRSLRGFWMRALVFLLLFIGLANPSLRQEERRPLSDIALLVLDQSSSQKIGRRTQNAQQALETVSKAISALGAMEYRIINVPDANPNQGGGTRLISALISAKNMLPTERYAGAILISDGQVHDAADQSNALAAAGPIHALLTGQRDEKDRRLVIDQAPVYSIVGTENSIRLHIEDIGDIATQKAEKPVTITIKQGSSPAQQRQLMRGQTTDLPIIVEHSGTNIFEISAEPLEGEISTNNNRAIVSIQGVRDRLKVLLVSGEPHPGTRSLRNLLKSDSSVDLIHFTILRPPDKQDNTPPNELSLIAFPTRELFLEKLDQFDLVIFDRYAHQALLPAAYLANVADYVRNGGAVLISAGPEFTEDGGLYDSPLMDVIPIQPDNRLLEEAFIPMITIKGGRHPVTNRLFENKTISSSPWGHWFRAVAANHLRGEVIMSGPEQKPLLTLSREGKGRVAILLSDQAWLWARGFEKGGPWDGLMRNMSHWLMKEPELEEEALRVRSEHHGFTVERQAMTEAIAPILMKLPSGETKTLELQPKSPGLWQTNIRIEEPGIYHFSDGQLEAVAAWNSDDALEERDLLATDKILSPLITANKGSLNWIVNSLPRLVKIGQFQATSGPGWMGLRANNATQLLAVKEFPQAAALILLGLIFGLIGMIWWREGR